MLSIAALALIVFWLVFITRGLFFISQNRAADTPGRRQDHASSSLPMKRSSTGVPAAKDVPTRDGRKKMAASLFQTPMKKLWDQVASPGSAVNSASTAATNVSGDSEELLSVHSKSDRLDEDFGVDLLPSEESSHEAQTENAENLYRQVVEENLELGNKVTQLLNQVETQRVKLAASSARQDELQALVARHCSENADLVKEHKKLKREVVDLQQTRSCEACHDLEKALTACSESAAAGGGRESETLVAATRTLQGLGVPKALCDSFEERIQAGFSSFKYRLESCRRVDAQRQEAQQRCKDRLHKAIKAFDETTAKCTIEQMIKGTSNEQQLCKGDIFRALNLFESAYGLDRDDIAAISTALLKYRIEVLLGTVDGKSLNISEAKPALERCEKEIACCDVQAALELAQLDKIHETLSAATERLAAATRLQEIVTMDQSQPEPETRCELGETVESELLKLLKTFETDQNQAQDELASLVAAARFPPTNEQQAAISTARAAVTERQGKVALAEAVATERFPQSGSLADGFVADVMWDWSPAASSLVKKKAPGAPDDQPKEKPDSIEQEQANVEAAEESLIARGLDLISLKQIKARLALQLDPIEINVDALQACVSNSLVCFPRDQLERYAHDEFRAACMILEMADSISVLRNAISARGISALTDSLTKSARITWKIDLLTQPLASHFFAKLIETGTSLEHQAQRLRTELESDSRLETAMGAGDAVEPLRKFVAQAIEENVANTEAFRLAKDALAQRISVRLVIDASAAAHQLNRLEPREQLQLQYLVEPLGALAGALELANAYGVDPENPCIANASKTHANLLANALSAVGLRDTALQTSLLEMGIEFAHDLTLVTEADLRVAGMPRVLSRKAIKPLHGIGEQAQEAAEHSRALFHSAYV